MPGTDFSMFHCASPFFGVLVSACRSAAEKLMLVAAVCWTPVSQLSAAAHTRLNKLQHCRWQVG